MTENIIIAIIFIAIIVVIYFINWIKGKEENSVSNTLISTGCLLIASGIPAISDAIVDGIFQLLSLQAPTNEGSFFFRALIGLVLIILGLVLKFNLKKENLCAKHVRNGNTKDIDEPKAIADLKLAEHKVKEQTIDFVQLLMMIK